MVSNNKCKRCGEVETYKHLLWECREAKNIWQLFNEFLTNINENNEKVHEYDNLFRIGNKGNVSKIKMKIIQGMIQIERPYGWTIEKIKEIAYDIRNNELYNSTIKKIKLIQGHIKILNYIKKM